MSSRVRIEREAPPVFLSDPEILGGEVVFAGTRVPVKNLVDYLADEEYGLAEFLEGFPSVHNEQALGYLEVTLAAMTGAEIGPSPEGRGYDGAPSISRDRATGELVFADTDVRVKTLVDHLANRRTIDTFLEAYPSVDHEHVVGYLEATLDAANRMVRGARAAR